MSNNFSNSIFQIIKTFKMGTLNIVKTYSFTEVAKELGVIEDEVIKIAKENGLLDENGHPTEYAIEEGLFAVEVMPIDNETLIIGLN